MPRPASDRAVSNPSRRCEGAGCRYRISKASSANSTSDTGKPSSIHSKKGMRRPAIVSIMPSPIRLGGLPTGVAKPPTVAA